MRRIVVLIAATCLVGPAILRPADAAPAPDKKSAQHALEQQRKAMEQGARHQQQLEKKLMDQQRKAIQEQLRAEQRLMEQQKKSFLQQQNAAQHPASQPHHASAHAGTVYHASRPYYGHSRHHRTPYRQYRQMPARVDPETLALHQLKKSLDSVRTGSAVTPAEQSAIKSALIRVVEVPRTPSIGSVTTLAGHLAEGLAQRRSAGAETAAMALTLRGVMNSTDLPDIDLTEIMNEHRAALKASKFRPSHVAAIMDSLKSISNQERAHR